MSSFELTFRLPYTELHPHYKSLVSCFRNHGFCILECEALLDPTFNNDHQLEAFRCAIREHCNEEDRELIIEETVDKDGMPIIIFELAPKGHTGTLPEIWDEKDELAAMAVQGKKSNINLPN